MLIMLLKDIVEMAQSSMAPLENAIDNMFRELELDVYFSNHFKQRILDNGTEARDVDVSAQDIFKAFNKLKIKYGDALFNARRNPKEFVGILKDISTNLNIPFTIDYDKFNKRFHKLTAITLMKKRNFMPNARGGKVLTVN